MAELAPPIRRRFSTRAAAVFAAGLSFALMLLSGLVLVIAPAGRIARDLGWTLATLDRTQWEVLHLTASVLFTAVVLWHLALHAATLKNLVWGAATHSLRHGTELLVAALAVLAIIALVLADLPPASWLRLLAGFMKREYW